MSDLSEIVFENLNLPTLLNIVDALLLPECLSISLNGNELMYLTGGKQVGSAVSEMDSGDCFFFSNRKIKCGDYEISPCNAQILRLGEKYDLNLIFDDEATVSPHDGCLASSLKSFAESIAQEFNACDFYGGLEPAQDEETRYFSAGKLGPLSSRT